MAIRPARAPEDGRQARWDEHNRQRRQTILDAALAVLEDGQPGAEFHVQQIADRAGSNRTVVYRHFADRNDLDRAGQVEISTCLTARLAPEVNLDGTVEAIIGRIVSTYVEWVVAHPALHACADQSDGALEEGTAQLASALVQLLEAAIELLGVELSEDERACVEPLDRPAAPRAARRGDQRAALRVGAAPARRPRPAPRPRPRLPLAELLRPAAT